MFVQIKLKSGGTARLHSDRTPSLQLTGAPGTHSELNPSSRGGRLSCTPPCAQASSFTHTQTLPKVPSSHTPWVTDCACRCHVVVVASGHGGLDRWSSAGFSLLSIKFHLCSCLSLSSLLKIGTICSFSLLILSLLLPPHVGNLNLSLGFSS